MPKINLNLFVLLYCHVSIIVVNLFSYSMRMMSLRLRHVNLGLTKSSCIVIIKYLSDFLPQFESDLNTPDFPTFHWILTCLGCVNKTGDSSSRLSAGSSLGSSDNRNIRTMTDSRNGFHKDQPPGNSSSRYESEFLLFYVVIFVHH